MNIGSPVGILYYSDEATPIHIEDRVLAHVKAIVTLKLRRSESFTLSWVHPDDEQGGRSTIWLHSSIPLRFVFNEPEPVQLNPQWIQDLAAAANSPAGIMLVAEQIEPTPAAESDPDADALAPGKLIVEDLSINSLTVAGVELHAVDVLGEEPGQIDS